MSQKITLLILPIDSILVFSLVAESIEHLHFPAVFNFGDSNCNTGGLVAEPLEPPNGQNYFGKSSGRFCDGRLIIDFLMDAMDLPFLNAYLVFIGSPTFRKGCNFTAAGSTILPATASSVSPFSFGVQVAQFLRFKNRVEDLLSKGILNESWEELFYGAWSFMPGWYQAYMPMTWQFDSFDFQSS